MKTGKTLTPVTKKPVSPDKKSKRKGQAIAQPRLSKTAKPKPQTKKPKVPEAPKQKVSQSKAGSPPVSNPRALIKAPSSAKLVRPLTTGSKRVAGARKADKPVAPRKRRTIPRAAQQQPMLQLPEAYGDGRFVLLTRDPFWLYCYWDLTQAQESVLWEGENPALRLIQLEDKCDPKEIRRFLLTKGARSWYFQVNNADRVFRAELGQVDRHGQFQPLMLSNASSTPRDSVSPNADIRYASVTLHVHGQEGAVQTDVHPGPGQARADRFYHHSVGGGKLRTRRFGASSAEFLEELNLPSSETLHSAVHVPASLPPTSPGERTPTPGKDWWLVLDADLTVYGATTVGSKVSILGLPVNLDSEGRFSARFSLPDGVRDIPVDGVSPDGDFKKGARIRVERNTDRY